MRKILLAILIAAFAITTHAGLADVNHDGVVTAADVTRLYDYLLYGSLADYDEYLDTNFDGVITAADVTNVYDVLLGN